MNEDNEYKVVKILDSENIIINAGEDDGIKIGDDFEIVGKGIEIKIPGTDTSLGNIDNVKDSVTVVKLYPKMCMCSHISEHNSISTLAAKLNGMYKTEKFKRTLNVNKDQITREEGQESIISENDIAKKVIPLDNIKSTKN